MEEEKDRFLIAIPQNIGTYPNKTESLYYISPVADRAGLLRVLLSDERVRSRESLLLAFQTLLTKRLVDVGGLQCQF